MRRGFGTEWITGGTASTQVDHHRKNDPVRKKFVHSTTPSPKWSRDNEVSAEVLAHDEVYSPCLPKSARVQEHLQLSRLSEAGCLFQCYYLIHARKFHGPRGCLQEQGRGWERADPYLRGHTPNQPSTPEGKEL